MPDDLPGRLPRAPQQDLARTVLRVPEADDRAEHRLCLLLAEPDFGAAIVLLATAFAMMFVAGARFRDFFCSLRRHRWRWRAGGDVAVSTEALTGFLDPWADPYDSGFQLTQSLIAIGRGEWFGVGLGDGVQKLFYLPEAHTDFVFAVFAEEFGLLGSLLLIALFLALLWRIFRLGMRAPSPSVSSKPIWRSVSVPGSACRRSSISASTWACCRPRD